MRTERELAEDIYIAVMGGFVGSLGNALAEESSRKDFAKGNEATSDFPFPELTSAQLADAERMAKEIAKLTRVIARSFISVHS